ncbi:CocE/NonD family hydrolase [Pseudonocardia sp. GCM10023141]|uniref:CocE/NonD family hydrolase n=1 Tax=Pseudonocardia sp. GCM10023141 TaxID=3252653 RepID=UPI003611B7A8
MTDTSSITGEALSVPGSIGGNRYDLADRIATRLLRLPAARTGYTRREERTPMRDGAVLVSEHYVPLTDHPLGTVLTRTPYGRMGPLDVMTSRTLAARGYHVLVQSCRGTFGSGGEFDPMGTDHDDAHDTVAWLREQEWFDGRLATTGASYLGWTQWALLADPPPELKAAVVLVGPHDMGDVVYGSGTFSLNDFLSWSHQIVHQEDGGGLVSRVLKGAAGRKKLTAALNTLPLGAASDGFLTGQAPWYAKWVGHPDPKDAYWGPRQAIGALSTVDLPVLLISGWQDLFLRQSIEQYTALHERGVDVALTVGPWTHLGLALRGSGISGRETLQWLDEHLAGATGRTRSAPVRINVTGADEWRELPAWPPAATTQERWLRPHGALGRARSEGDGPLATFRYDPADPTPSVGGRVLTAGAGVHDNRELEARADVVTFTTEPLSADLDVIGSPVLELTHSSDNPHVDVFVRLCDVDPKGRSHNVSDTLLRLDASHPAGTPRTLRLELDPCAHRLRVGHRLRLLVAGGAHPRWARNPGTGEPPLVAATLKPAVHTVHGGKLELPVVT